MTSMQSEGLVIDTIVCLTLTKWETVSGQFGGSLIFPMGMLVLILQSHLQYFKNMTSIKLEVFRCPAHYGRAERFSPLRAPLYA